MSKPNINSFNEFTEIFIQKYERYLPTAFDESPSILEKVNKVIQQLHDMGKLTNGVVTQWNEVMNWVMTDGLTDEVNVKISDMVTNGELGSLINDTLLVDINDKISGIINFREYGIDDGGIVGNSDTIQSLINEKRLEAISSDMEKVEVVYIPSGKYVIDKEIKMSPFIKLKSLGVVHFLITFNGSAFYIAPDANDPKFTSSDPVNLFKNAWNRGDYFDGANGGFIFTTTLDKNSTGNNTCAIELGDRNTGSDSRTPISRYSITQVNAFGLNSAIKLNAVNNYIGSFIRCHFELNSHAVWFYSAVPGSQINSGENFVFDNCVIAGSTKEAIKVQSAGHDISFQNTSFDFNASPLIKSLHSGCCIRLNNCYIEKIGNGTTDSQIIYQSESSLSAETGGRNSFYAKNLIMFLHRPTELFKNVPNSGGGYINTFLDLDGVEVRYSESDPYKIQNRYMIDETKRFRLLSHKIINGTTTMKNHVSRQTNMLQNSDFSKSVLGASLTSANLEADLYWQAGYHDNAEGLTVVEQGVSGSKALRYNIVRPENSLRLEYKHLLDVNAGEILEFSALFKLNKISSRNDVRYRFQYYDAKGDVISTDDYTDIFSTNSIIETVDSNNFRTSRSFAVMYVPKFAVKVKPMLVLGNIDSDYIVIDDIHFGKVN